jgi:hypothetical protein
MRNTQGRQKVGRRPLRQQPQPGRFDAVRRGRGRSVQTRRRSSSTSGGGLLGALTSAAPEVLRRRQRNARARRGGARKTGWLALLGAGAGAGAGVAAFVKRRTSNQQSEPATPAAPQPVGEEPTRAA